MAQNPQGPKSKWGVGSFFQQAVAGVESRLDNILADGEEGSPQAVQRAAQTRQTGVSPARSSSSMDIIDAVNMAVQLMVEL